MHSALQVGSQDRVGQLAAQCAVQPGLAGVYGEVLCQSREGAELYTQAYPQFTGDQSLLARAGEISARLALQRAVFDGVSGKTAWGRRTQCSRGWRCV